ncbi:MAG: putative aminoglycoside phosphotransferase [Actinomycetia bacterium]|nr:putative aminoglycoside phosphotransferase [Actinomycetes bacterium]
MEGLGPWVADNIPGASGELKIDQLSGGSSNLTYRVRDGERDWVLRRPPLTHVLATANDMKREYTVQRGLHGTDVPVPEVVAFCADEAVIGGPFYLMEMLDGIVFNDASDVAHLDEAQSLAATHELVDVLARLHAVDPASVGLGEFGKPTGFVTRQVGRWSTQWEKSKQRELPEIDEVARILAANIPPEGGASIVHGDYSFNNTMFRKDEPARMLAVLDWEMSTLGDPLTDVGMVAMYWGEVGEMMWAKREHPQPHRANAGFPSVDDLLERYALTSGRDLSGIAFYRALATFKLAVITEGAHARIAGTDPERAPQVDASVRQLASAALDAAKGLTHG